MFTPPRLVQHTLTVFFARLPNIRRYANLLEDALSAGCPSGYLAPQAIPVPDEVGPDVPRLIFSAANGFSQVFVTQTSLSLAINYSEDWQLDREQCLAHVRKRAHVIFDLVKQLPVEPSFAGVSTRIHVYEEKVGAESVQAVRRLLQSDLPIGDVNELSARWSRSVAPIYFQNLLVQSFGSVNPSSDDPVRFQASKRVVTGVEILGDANDRYGYNEVEDYHTELSKALDLIDIGAVDAFGLADSIGRDCV